MIVGYSISGFHLLAFLKVSLPSVIHGLQPLGTLKKLTASIFHQR